jgi:hypothetical protein
MANNHSEIEKRLWASADELRANSKLKSSEYSVPVLGLIFLRYADHKFSIAEKELAGKGTGRRAIGKEDYQAKGVMYLPSQARFSKLLNLPEGENIGKAINEAMKAVEIENEELKGVLPKSYNKIENSTLVSLLKNFSAIPVDAEGDTFGKIYEYFLGNFARAEGQKGGEFFTPTSLVKLIVQIIEPYHGRIFDPACGSGGMFVQSADFIKAHKSTPSVEISVYGQERVDETRHLCLMNLAVHGLSGDIRQGNSYYEDLHASVGKFDFVMANPPFNVDKVDKEKIKDDPRYPFGMPKSGPASRGIDPVEWIAQNTIDFGKIRSGSGVVMGGQGSGNWWRWQGKKSTVEESLSLAMKDLRRHIHAGAAGTFTWTWGSGSKSSIGYSVTGSYHVLIVTLYYCWRDAEDVSIPVQLTTTPTQFGGRRWWFICPLIVGGVECNRRAGKLYLPPGARYFGCRKCHRLTYRSCQEAHREDRLFGQLGFGPEVARMMRAIGRNR